MADRFADARCIWVVEQGPNPSSDFFILPHLAPTGIPVRRAGWHALPPPEELADAVVVFVRYVTPGWRALVEQARQQMAGLVYFMDDDLLDLSATRGQGLRYRLKLARLGWRHRRWLQRMQCQLWVSVPYLHHKYAGWSPLLVPPRALPEPTASPVTLFYHGSASHLEEARWLYPVIKQVLAENDNLCFEIIGDGRINKLFRHLPRVSVLHPMSWTSYLALHGRGGRDIGLAPLLDQPFNKARSHTKFFDITRAGAVGIYAAGPVYEQVVEQDKTGLLLPMVQEIWVEEILDLAQNENVRYNMQILAKNHYYNTKTL